MYGKWPFEVWDLPSKEFHIVIAFANAAETQKTEMLRELVLQSGKDDMGPGIAVAVAAGAAAAK